MKSLKYHSKKVTYDGKEFDSVAERDRFIELRCRQIRGEIAGLHRQVRFCIIPATYGLREKRLKTKSKLERYCIEKAAYYTCDFCYLEKQDDGWVTVIEDCKSRFTRSLSDYVLRRKIMVKALYDRMYVPYSIGTVLEWNHSFEKSRHNRCVFRESEPQRGNKPTKITDR